MDWTARGTAQSSVRARQTTAPDVEHAAETGVHVPMLGVHAAESDAFAEKEAPVRSTAREARRRTPLGLTRVEWVVVAGVTLLACAVRFYRLDQPSSVVFDEVHFGGFAAKYLRRTFFMDVHPPLAKLMITLAAWLHGFSGDFDFSTIGNEYLVDPRHERVPYVAMRSVGALFGTLTVPLAYITLRAVGLRASSALLGALLVTFENALTTQSRLILLDAPLVFFVASALCAWSLFVQVDQRAPFSRRWWLVLTLTGAALGAVVSVKWVGLFTIATVGLGVVLQLWEHLGNMNVPIRTLVKHVAARALCLIVLPAAVYVSLFAVHFGILSRAGPGDTFMSWPFRNALEGNGVPDTYADVALGSTVTLQHYDTVGGYLHSHDHAYETGSGQQQITLYPFADVNNEWLLLRAPLGDEEFPVNAEGHATRPVDEASRFMHNVTHVRDGDIVRLLHMTTDKRMHTHSDFRPPISESDYQNEVTGYGFPDFGGDFNDNWRIQIHAQDADVRARDSERVHAIRTVFRLQHQNLGCFLYSHTVSLPDWGYGQQEVTCNNNAPLRNSLWYIESNTHPALPADAPRVNYRRPGFWSKLRELHGVMWDVNRQLTARHVYESRPSSWPLLRKGINFWTKHHRQVYLMGNPFVWWAATLCVCAYVGVRVLLALRAQRGYTDLANSEVVYYDRVCGFFLLAWALHYLPFWLMKRQLFLHHYLPALYISVLLLCTVFDAATQRFRPRMRLQIVAAVAAAALLVFWRYAPIAYATPWTSPRCENAILLRSWDFNCVDFPDDVATFTEYDSVVQRPDDAAPWFHNLQDYLHSKVLPAPRVSAAAAASASGTEGAAFAPLEGAGANAESAGPSAQNASDMPRVPNVSGMDNAQMHKAVMEGTSNIAPSASSVSSGKGM
ncbi:dolichyl-phosphate-mannose--protein mannosyltransferase [Malassezia sp. CBS 17886]|nr:dolichyl-phosphate-mannose--protein mannosyltransferase [Malassezia sp. CBS 17886]